MKTVKMLKQMAKMAKKAEWDGYEAGYKNGLNAGKRIAKIEAAEAELAAARESECDEGVELTSEQVNLRAALAKPGIVGTVDAATDY